jgi:hypothetical protein
MSRKSIKSSFVPTNWQYDNFFKVKNLGLFLLFIIFCFPFNLILLADLIENKKNKRPIKIELLANDYKINKELKNDIKPIGNPKIAQNLQQLSK